VSSDDVAAITAVIHRYAVACDERDLDTLRACFTPDARAEYSGVRLEPGVDHIVEHLRRLARLPLSQPGTRATPRALAAVARSVAAMPPSEAQANPRHPWIESLHRFGQPTRVALTMVPWPSTGYL
jgi:hypothetical protein